MTKILPSTATKPYRIKAYDGDNNSVTLSCDNFDCGRASTEMAMAAVEVLKKKMGWTGSGSIGWMGGTNHVFVFNYVVKPAISR